MTGVSIIALIGLLAYIAEQEVKSLPKPKTDIKFETILQQGYKSLNACKTRRDYVNVARGWVRRLMDEYGDRPECIDRIKELHAAIYRGWRKTHNYNF